MKGGHYFPFFLLKMNTIQIINYNWRLYEMTMLNQLKSGDIARIVNFEDGYELRYKFESKGLFEGSIIRVVSSFGLFTFSINSKIFSVNSQIAKKVRIIKLNQLLR